MCPRGVVETPSSFDGVDSGSLLDRKPIKSSDHLSLRRNHHHHHSGAPLLDPHYNQEELQCANVIDAKFDNRETETMVVSVKVELKSIVGEGNLARARMNFRLNVIVYEAARGYVRSASGDLRF